MEAHHDVRGPGVGRTRWLTVMLAAAVVAALAVLTSPGAEADHVPIHMEQLTSAEHNTFTDDVAVQVRDKPDGRPASVVNVRDASRIAVAEFTIQPGAWFPWHTHPGAGLIAVTEGDLVFVFADDCRERLYGEGDAFADTGILHTAYNPGATETVVIATFVGVPAGAPLAEGVGTAEAEALNASCGTDAPVPPPMGTAHQH